VKRGPEGYTPTQLSEKLGVPGPTLSFHLKELQRANLIEARREGRFLYNCPNFPRMNEVVAEGIGSLLLQSLSATFVAGLALLW
jgi:DNA-binding transcriptional ArsR family regulator